MYIHTHRSFIDSMGSLGHGNDIEVGVYFSRVGCEPAQWHLDPNHNFTIQVLQSVAVCCSVLQCVAVCCSAYIWHLDPNHNFTIQVLQSVAVCCSVLQYAVCCSALGSKSQLRYTGVAECCSVVCCGVLWCGVVQCGAVYCSLLQCVAVCCSVLQCVAVCCSVV